MRASSFRRWGFVVGHVSQLALHGEAGRGNPLLHVWTICLGQLGLKWEEVMIGTGKHSRQVLLLLIGYSFPEGCGVASSCRYSAIFPEVLSTKYRKASRPVSKIIWSSDSSSSNPLRRFISSILYPGRSIS